MNENELYHYGVKGMKWRVRKAKTDDENPGKVKSLLKKQRDQKYRAKQRAAMRTIFQKKLQAKSKIKEVAENSRTAHSAYKWRATVGKKHSRSNEIASIDGREIVNGPITQKRRKK